MSLLTAAQPSTGVQDTSESPVLYIALELAARSWRAHSLCPGRGQRQRAIPGSVEAVAKEIERLRKAFDLPSDSPVVTCYEASYQGFSVHRSLTLLGVENYVTDPKTVSCGRRGRVAKTDRLDGEKLLRVLVRFHRDGERDLRPVRVPPREVEDFRRIQRERERLIHERNSHVSRIRSVLETVGISIPNPGELSIEDLESLECAPGNVMGRCTQRELVREIKRLKHVKQHIRELEEERKIELKAGKSKLTEMARGMLLLRGIGPCSAMTLIYEMGWRKFRNRKEVAASVGLTPTPHQSGDLERERGISKSGNRRVRRLMIELAWMWLRWQPQSAISQWYTRRFSGTRRGKKIGIVAVARKLLIALWQFWEHGIVPERAILSQRSF